MSLVMWLRIDQALGVVRDYLAYRAATTRCFWRGPRIGHVPGANYQCKRCPKWWSLNY